MKILSLFDGISCARVALERAGIPVEAYYASEIDKYAMQISAKNYPDIVQLGDIKDIRYTMRWNDEEYPNWNIDLLIGGSPCQDLSIAKKDRKGLDGERSGLFWEYVRILKEVKPKYFILENVNSMPKEAKALITETLGVEPIMINASLVSAQNRKRLFWTNIPNVTLPEDRGILLKDILENGENRVLKNSWKYREGKPRLYEGKCPTLSANMGTAGGHVPIAFANDAVDIKGVYGKRVISTREVERLQGVPDNYTEGVSNSQRYKTLGNAFNVDVVSWILSFIPNELSTD